jgi:hypothetical protein
MKKMLQTLLVVFVLTGIGFAQDNLNFTALTSGDLKKEIEDLNSGMNAGMSVLNWTDGSAPSLFKISAGIFLGFGSAGKNPTIGLKDDVFFVSGAGLQAGFGTAGFEVYARLLPETDAFDYSLKSLGFGLKYEISDMFPGPGLPDIALFADYNTLDFSLNQEKTVTVDNVSGDVNTDIKLAFSSINIGAIASYDLVVVRVYGKLALELGSTDMDWNRAVLSGNNIVADKTSSSLTDTGFRYAIGAVLFGFRAEIGGRGSNLFAGLGYGISI